MELHGVLDSARREPRWKSSLYIPHGIQLIGLLPRQVCFRKFILLMFDNFRALITSGKGHRIDIGT